MQRGFLGNRAEGPGCFRKSAARVQSTPPPAPGVPSPACVHLCICVCVACIGGEAARALLLLGAWAGAASERARAAEPGSLGRGRRPRPIRARQSAGGKRRWGLGGLFLLPTRTSPTFAEAPPLGSPRAPPFFSFPLTVKKGGGVAAVAADPPHRACLSKHRRDPGAPLHGGKGPGESPLNTPPGLPQT